MAEPNRQPPLRYVMLFPGRCGSTYLTDHLGNHPQIVAHYEILSQYQESWWQQQAFLEELIFTKRSLHIEAIGFKAKVTSVLDLQQFERFLTTNQFQVVHLTRRNELKLAISIVRARILRRQQGTSNLIHQEQPELGPSIIPLSEFAEAQVRLRQQSRVGRMVERLKLPTLRLSYEDLLQDEQATLSRLWRFLGVRQIATTGKTRKATPQDIRQAVVNLDELIEHYPEMAKFIDQV